MNWNTYVLETLFTKCIQFVLLFIQRLNRLLKTKSKTILNIHIQCKQNWVWNEDANSLNYCLNNLDTFRFNIYKNKWQSSWFCWQVMETYLCSYCTNSTVNHRPCQQSENGTSKSYQINSNLIHSVLNWTNTIPWSCTIEINTRKKNQVKLWNL